MISPEESELSPSAASVVTSVGALGYGGSVFIFTIIQVNSSGHICSRGHL